MESVPTRFRFHARVWLYSGASGWHFVTVPEDTSELIREAHRPNHRGWGSLPVAVTIGKTTWTTSIFWDKKAGAYLLPIKAEVRKTEAVELGDDVNVSVEIRTH